MPIFKNARVTNSEQVWASPDGQRKLFNVTMTLETGQTVSAKSWSERLVPGFSGDLETYEKEGKQGIETFVRQAPKEGGFSPTGSPRSGYGAGGSKGISDPFTMYLSYAKDILVAMMETSGYDKEKYGELLDAASAGGHKLHAARPGAEPPKADGSESTSRVTEQLPISTASPDPVHDVPDEPINLNDIPF